VGKGRNASRALAINDRRGKREVLNAFHRSSPVSLFLRQVVPNKVRCEKLERDALSKERKQGKCSCVVR
jgi:hypothetical protein